jgi:HlyD family secretion protein
MRRRILLIPSAALVAAVAATAYFYDAKAAEPAYTTAVVTRDDVVQSVKATGTLEAVTTVAVGSQVSGTIAALEADFNSQVRKGQVIARLEPSLFAAQVEQARATMTRLQADAERAHVALEDARVQQRRAETLSAQQLLPTSELEASRVATRQAEASVKSAQAQVTQARASLQQAQVNLSHTTITAPIDGTVISRSVDVGQTVAASMQAPVLFTIAQDLRHMQVNASVDEADIGTIAAGQAVTFRVDAYPGQVFTGGVRQVRLAPVVDQNVVSYVTVIDVPNPDLRLKPGMTATVAIEIARADDVLEVPSAALRFRPDQDARPSGAAASGAGRARGARRVWVLEPGGALKPVAVETGISDGTTTAIVGGALAERDRVITGVTPTATAGTSAGTSPFVPQRPRRTGTASSSGRGGGR